MGTSRSRASDHVHAADLETRTSTDSLRTGTGGRVRGPETRIHTYMYEATHPYTRIQNVKGKKLI